MTAVATRVMKCVHFITSWKMRKESGEERGMGVLLGGEEVRDGEVKASGAPAICRFL